MSARETMRERDLREMCARSHVVRELRGAGYRILAPGEIDPVTVERCAKVADDARKMRVRLYVEFPAGISVHKAVQAEEIATAIRSLKGGDHV